MLRPSSRKVLARVLTLQARGYSQTKIARRLGISGGWVNRLLDEHRREQQTVATQGVVHVGALLSNAAYNLAQGGNALPADTRQRLDDLRREWDAALAELRKVER